MADPGGPALPELDEDSALRAILEGTSAETGGAFFAALVKNLAKALGTHGAWVTEYAEDRGKLRALAFWLDGEWVEDYEYVIRGTPCDEVVTGAELVHIPDKVIELYPQDPDFAKIGAVSYMGAPLLDVDGSVLGNLAALHTQPLPEEPRGQAILRIFAARASAEVQRLQAEAELLRREEKLNGLVDGAMDAIIELDPELEVTRANPAAARILGGGVHRIVGEGFGRFVSPASLAKLRSLIDDLDARPEGERQLWIAGGLDARRLDGAEFPAEATLSRFDVRRATFHTLILRSVDERLEAEKKIRSLTSETEYLRDEVRALRSFDEVIGDSAPMRQVLAQVHEVAETGATVLLLGETGTGKEVIARAIHAQSPRRGSPMIKVNCAAIPAALIESELFGHEKGAFTGATQRREGRFALAHGGSIFLDEIGDLPLELQGKLLRVLQEGEFEPLGSSTTRKVDVRVLAATNRDLQQAVSDKTFREDLYYRLNVFPIRLPPLRDRREDVGLLASAFALQFAQRMGRDCRDLSADCLRRLKAYSWPGNVRELQNVMERAVITSRGGDISLDRALPETDQGGAVEPLPEDRPGTRILKTKDLQKLERDNIALALETCGWRVSGPRGAARLLDMNASTLSSRMKSLGIKSPRQQ